MAERLVKVTSLRAAFIGNPSRHEIKKHLQQGTNTLVIEPFAP